MKHLLPVYAIFISLASSAGFAELLPPPVLPPLDQAAAPAGAIDESLKAQLLASNEQFGNASPAAPVAAPAPVIVASNTTTKETPAKKEEHKEEKKEESVAAHEEAGEEEAEEKPSKVKAPNVANVFEIKAYRYKKHTAQDFERVVLQFKSKKGKGPEVRVAKKNSNATITIDKSTLIGAIPEAAINELYQRKSSYLGAMTIDTESTDSFEISVRLKDPNNAVDAFWLNSPPRLVIDAYPSSSARASFPKLNEAIAKAHEDEHVVDESVRSVKVGEKALEPLAPKSKWRRLRTEIFDQLWDVSCYHLKSAVAPAVSFGVKNTNMVEEVPAYPEIPKVDDPDAVVCFPKTSQLTPLVIFRSQPSDGHYNDRAPASVAPISRVEKKEPIAASVVAPPAPVAPVAPAPFTPPAPPAFPPAPQAAFAPPAPPAAFPPPAFAPPAFNPAAPPPAFAPQAFPPPAFPPAGAPSAPQAFAPPTPPAPPAGFPPPSFGPPPVFTPGAPFPPPNFGPPPAKPAGVSAPPTGIGPTSRAPTLGPPPDRVARVRRYHFNEEAAPKRQLSSLSGYNDQKYQAAYEQYLRETAQYQQQQAQYQLQQSEQQQQQLYAQRFTGSTGTPQYAVVSATPAYPPANVAIQQQQQTQRQPLNLASVGIQIGTGVLPPPPILAKASDPFKKPDPGVPRPTRLPISWKYLPSL